MNGVLKFVLSIFAVFAAVVGVLAVIDQINNKNRIKGDYLECDTAEDEEEI